MWNQPAPSNGGLPPVTQEYFMPGVPHRPAWVPSNIPVRSNMRNMLSTVHGHLILEIQQRANQNPLRQAMFWDLIANNYNNQDYLDLLIMCLEYTELLLASNVPPQTAVQQAAAELCSIRASMGTQRHPALAQMLDQRAAADVERWLAHSQQIGYHVKNYMASNPDYGNAPQPNMGMGMPMGGGSQYHNPIGQPQPAGFGNMNTGFGGMRTGMPPRGGAMPDRSSQLWGENGHRPAQSDNSGGMRGFSLRPTKPRNQQQDQESTVQQQSTVQQIAKGEQPVEQIKTSVAPFRYRPEKGTRPSGKAPYQPTLFDPATHIALFEESGDVETEVVLSLEEAGVEYQKHETEYFFPDLRKGENAVRNREKAAQDFKNLLAAKDVEVYLNKLDESERGMADISNEQANGLKLSLMVTDDDLIVESDEYSDLSMASYLMDRGWSDVDLDDRSYRYRYMTASPIEFSGEDKIMYMELNNSSSYKVLLERVRNFIEKGPKTYTRMIDRMLAKHINEITKIRMGLSYSIESFVHDINDLRAAINQKYGSEMLELFDGTASELARQDFAYTKTRLLFGKEVSDDLISPTVRGLNVHLTIDAHDLCFTSNGSIGAVRESLFPVLYEALTTIWEDVRPDTRKVRLVTADGGKVLVYKSLISDHFLVGLE